MKRYLLYFACLVCMTIVSVGCEKLESLSDTISEVTVYGSVIDATTGTPIYNAQIELDIAVEEIEELGIVSSTVTGQDGSYEFLINDVSKKKTYVVLASKQGYDDEMKIISFSNVGKGGRVKADFQLYIK